MIKISAAKNAPRLVARSRRDENHGGQKRGEISGEISVRSEFRRSKRGEESLAVSRRASIRSGVLKI